MRPGRLFFPPYETVEKGHGRIETRRIAVAPSDCINFDFPGAKQIFRIEREVYRGKEQKLST
jgi:hypothetical protein